MPLGAGVYPHWGWDPLKLASSETIPIPKFPIPMVDSASEVPKFPSPMLDPTPEVPMLTIPMLEPTPEVPMLTKFLLEKKRC